MKQVYLWQYKKEGRFMKRNNTQTIEKTENEQVGDDLLFKLSKRSSKQKEIREGLKMGLTISLGYIPVGIAFGLLAKTTGFSLFHTMMFSIVLYAGAGQFMAVDLISSGVHPVTVILSVILLNLRLMIMSASISLHTEKIRKSVTPLFSFWLTDEAFSILSFRKDEITEAFSLSLQGLAYSSWALATFLGFIAGDFMAAVLQKAFGVGLTCMFVGLLTPSVKGNRKGFVFCAISFLIYFMIDYFKLFSAGWDIVIGIVVSSLIGYFVVKNRRIE